VETRNIEKKRTSICEEENRESFGKEGLKTVTALGPLEVGFPMNKKGINSRNDRGRAMRGKKGRIWRGEFQALTESS